MAGPFSSRLLSDTTAARLPPALSPPTEMRFGSTPSCSAFAATQSCRGVAIHHRRGKLVLGRQPIIHRDHHRSRAMRRSRCKPRRACPDRRPPSRRRGSRPAPDAEPASRACTRESGSRPRGPGIRRFSMERSGSAFRRTGFMLSAASLRASTGEKDSSGGPPSAAMASSSSRTVGSSFGLSIC